MRASFNFILSLCFAPGLALAQDHGSLLQQLTTPEYKSDQAEPYQNNEFNGMRSIKVSEKYCKELELKRGQITAEPGSPEFRQALNALKPLQAICYQQVSVNDAGEITGFTLTNKSKNKINPRTAPNGSDRQFNFVFEERSRQNPHLRITENSGLTSRMSHDFLETTIVFIPRRVTPYLQTEESSGECYQKVFLPTNEFAIFDAITKEIIGGVLEEAPMDMTESRHRRKFAGIEYKGNGIMIRADRRSGTPEHNYAQSYNVNERIKEAVITHKGKTCHVSKNLIWEGADRPNSSPYFKYATDQDFLDQVINPICGWNLSLQDIM